MANNKDFKVKNGIQPTVYHEGVGTVTSGTEGYNFSNASDTSNTLDISTSVGTNPLSIRWKPDGLKLFVLSLTADTVYTFTLTSAYDLSTATVDATSYNFFTTEASNPITLHFNNDGSKLYIPAYTAAKQVYQYSLSTAYDLSSESYDGAVTISSVVYGIGAIAFKSDGTRAYFFDNFTLSNKIWQYDLSTAWDVTSTLSNQVTLDISSIGNAGSDLLFDPDGSSFFVTSGSNIIQYNLSTAWDVSTATQGVSFDASSIDSSPRSPNYNSDGTRLFFSAAANREIRELNTEKSIKTLDLSTGSVFEITPTSDIQIGLSNPAASGTVSQATLLLDGVATNTYDLANASYDGVSFSVAAQDGSPRGLFFKADGTKMYVLGDAGDSVFQYTLSTSWDVSTSSYDSVSLSVSAQDNSPRDLYISPDGTKMYIAGGTGDEVNEYSLSTAWDISTASYVQVFSVSAQDTAPEGIFFKPDGTKMYILGEAGDDVNEYTLSTSWDVSTASYTQNFTISTQSTIPGSLSFSSDGFTMYILSAYLNDGVYAYNLSTAWDISTATYSGVFFDVSAQETSPTALYIKTDGNNLYLTGTSTAKVYQYSTASVSTITYPTNITWPGGTAPTSPAIGDTDVLTFSTRDGGTTYQAAIAVDGAA